MGISSDVLDAAVAADRAPASHVGALRFPRLSGWEPSRDLHTNFLRPVRDGVISIEARVVSRGRRTAYCEALFADATGVLVARAGVTQMILERRSAA